MTVESSSNRAQYATNGTTGPWTVPFYFLDNSHLQVIHTDSSGNETVLTLTTNYSVTGAGVQAGGTVTTVTAYAAGGFITVLRNVPVLQQTDYVDGDKFPAGTHEQALDKLTMILQQQAEVIARAMVFGPSDTAGSTLPAVAVRASKLLGFNSLGQVLLSAPVSGSAADLALNLADTAAIANGDALVGVKRTATGSTATTVHGWIEGQRINVKADFGATGAGDETAKVQAAINSFTGVACDLDLGGLALSITTVNVPNGKAITVRNGSVTVTGANGRGFSKVTTVVAAPARDMAFDNVQFTRSVAAGSCIFINLAWQDASGGVIVKPNCSFTLTNGAYGVRLARSFGNSIAGRYTMDGGAAGTSVAVLCDASEVVAADANPSCPFETVVDHAFFTGGIAFDQLLIVASVWNSFEGFSFGPGCRFYSSIFNAKKYNSLKFHGVHGVSWKATLDSGINTSISGGYYDRNTNGDWLFKFLTTIRDVQGVAFGGGAVLSAQSKTGDMVIFSDAGTAVGKQITNVAIGTMYLVGGLNDVATPIRGFKCDHNNLRNLNFDGGQSFQNLYACISFTQAVNRSVIKAFDARDISFYAENVATGFGTLAANFNRFEGVYQVYTLDIVVPTYIASGVAETIYKQLVTFDNMMRAPIATISAVTAPFGAGNFTITAPLTYRNSVEINLVKNAAAPGATRGGCGATLTLDAGTYLSPL